MTVTFVAVNDYYFLSGITTAIIPGEQDARTASVNWRRIQSKRRYASASVFNGRPSGVCRHTKSWGGLRQVPRPHRGQTGPPVFRGIRVATVFCGMASSRWRALTVSARELCTHLPICLIHNIDGFH
jgi:hypothetical protein